MKPTQLAELFANIRKTFVSFFSILMFVALGVGIFLGINWVAPAMQGAAGKAFDEGSFHNVQIQYPYGLTDADLQQLSNVEGVTDVEAGYQSFQTTFLDGEKRTVKLQSMGERIDTLSVVEGELPSKADEVAVVAAAADACGIAVGDTIAFEPDASPDDVAVRTDDQSAAVEDNDGMKYLNGASYRVAAIVNSPEYIATSSETFGISTSGSGSVEIVAWAPVAAFDASAYQGGYPVVNVRCSGLQGLDSFGAEYEQASGAIEGDIADLGATLAKSRYDDLHNQAQKKIDEAQAALDGARKQIADGEKQLADGRAELEAKKAEGEARLAEAYGQLIEGEEAKAEGEQALAQARSLYREASSALAAMKDDDTVVIEGRSFTVAELKAFLPQAEAALNSLQAEYDAKVAELNDGWGQYYAGQAELEAAVAEGEQKIADGQRQVEEAKAQVAEGEPKLEKAKEQLAAMKRYDWTVVNRSGNVGAGEISVFGGVTTNLSFSMALLFVIVGLLVSYSAVSRIVHEQITQIGTKKALGLRGREITASFLLYAGMAVLAGAIVGTLVGVTLVEGIIANVLGKMFTFGAFPPHFGLLQFLGVTALELVLVLGATWLACRGVLRQHAVELLRGEKPPEAKARFYEKWGVWNRLPLLTQTIVNNCMNDKRRVFSTVVGVAGCTALIVTAITLNDDVLKSYDRQYDNVYGFASIAYVDPSADGACDAVEDVFRDAGGDAASIVRKSLAMTEPSGAAAALHIIVPADAEAFARVYHVNPVSGGEPDFSQDGVWVSQAYRDHFGAKVGDAIEVDAGDGVKHEVPILGFYEFWLTYHEAVMGRDYYEREFDASFAPNAVLGNAEEVGGLSELDFGAVEGFDSVTDDKTRQYGNFATFSSVSSAVVLIYLALAALMAVVVLLNLNVMFIEEKKRELIVLMINGFSVRDAKRYIYNDTIVLTIVGIILGIVLGCVMGSVTVGSMEPSTAEFVKDVDWLAVGVGAGGSAVLSFVMSVIALRRIPRFELTDINKF